MFIRPILRKLPFYEQAKKIYYAGKNLSRRIRNSLTSTAIILLYHRVANVNEDPHKLCVSPSNFREQLICLKKTFAIIPLKELADNTKNRHPKKNSLAITFDDGYADNFTNALPILRELNVPATVFIVAGKINDLSPFYWDELTKPEDRGRALSTAELSVLAQDKLIEIGSHTLTHPNLTKLLLAEQEKEIVQSKKALEEILNKPVISFSYPFGSQDSFNNKTLELVKRAGYKYACANIHERVRANSDISALPRYIVRNWDVEEFKENMKKFI